MVYKLVVISDVHHDSERLRNILPIINSSNYLIFCGDGLNEVMSLRGEILVPIVCVKGNNDWNSNVSEVACITLGNKRALVTHGHRQDVRRGLGGLFAAARSKNCSLAFFGHTHSYCDYKYNGVHFINPGALNAGSYALVLSDGINFTCKQERVDAPFGQ